MKTGCLQLLVAQVMTKAQWLSEFSSLEMLAVPSVGWYSCADLLCWADSSKEIGAVNSLTCPGAFGAISLRNITLQYFPRWSKHSNCYHFHANIHCYNRSETPWERNLNKTKQKKGVVFELFPNYFQNILLCWQRISQKLFFPRCKTFSKNF